MSFFHKITQKSILMIGHQKDYQDNKTWKFLENENFERWALSLNGAVVLKFGNG